MSFDKNGFQVVRNVVSKQLLENLKIQFELMKDNYFFLSKISEEKNKYHFGDSQCFNSFSAYSPLFFESLSIQLKNKVSKIVNLNLYPTYSYARIYYKGSNLEPHIDRPSCEYSTTVCIDSTHCWDFHIKNRDGDENIVKLNPGDMCVYSGCELEHWRNSYEGDRQIQCFLHYVNVDGPYKKFKYDERPMMGLNKKRPEKTNNNLILYH